MAADCGVALNAANAWISGLDLRDRAAVEIPSGDLRLAGNRLLCLARSHPQEG
ncbi:MAG: hypothetical protein WCS65_05860 [Verrucomicrobiae bacterium]